MIDDITIMPCFSLTPSKVVSFNRVFRYSAKKQNLDQEPAALKNKIIKMVDKSVNNAVKKKFHNFKISENAYRNLKQKINWLYFLAKSRRVKTYSGKEIFNFKMAFITLTLPSMQAHSTVEITKDYFNQFLTEIRQRTGMKNYVWRLEFQKNGNVHYHLVTDSFLDYFFVKKIWNRILKKGGYVDAYQSKFQNLSLGQYNGLVNSNSKTDFAVIAKRYAKGCAENWANPNTVDVKSVVSGKKIANYISKYFGKNEQGNAVCNVLDNEANSFSLRLWFSSRSLSKLKTVTDFVEAVPYDIFTYFKEMKLGNLYIARWASIVYFEVFNLEGQIRILIEKILRNYAKKQEYQSAVSAYF